MAHLGARRVGSGWRLCEGDLEAGGGGWEGSPAVSVPRRPEEASGGDPKRQRGPSGCYRYPLIVNGSPRRATGRLRVALCEGVRVAGGGGWEGFRKAHRPAVSHDDPRRPQVEIRGGREARRDAIDTLTLTRILIPKKSQVRSRRARARGCPQVVSHFVSHRHATRHH